MSLIRRGDLGSTTRNLVAGRNVHSEQRGATVLGTENPEQAYCRAIPCHMLPNRSHDMAHILVLPSGIHLKASGRFLDGVSGCPSCCPASPRAEGMSALTYSLFGTLHSLCEAPQSTLVGSSVLQTDSGRAHY